jgi:hypothetical protein
MADDSPSRLISDQSFRKTQNYSWLIVMSDPRFIHIPSLESASGGRMNERIT